MFDILEFLELIGWGEWAQRYLSDTADPLEVTFSDVCFNTLPAMLQLFFLVFILNWVMGIIGDSCRFVGRGGKL